MVVVRARDLAAFDKGDATGILGRDGALRELSGASADLARAVLAFVVTPKSDDEIAAHLSELAGEPVRIEGAVADLLSLLREARAIEEAAPRGSGRITGLKAGVPARFRCVLALTGGVAASVAPSFIPILHARRFDVRVAATRRAARFVSPLALEAITHARFESSMWPIDPKTPVPHLELAAWADIVVVFPASATSIARIAQGSCATLVSALAVSTRAPVLIVPSMNERMATAPSVIRNLEQLRDDGFYVAYPGFGYEVAERPGARVAMLGAAPPLGVVADLAEAIASRTRPAHDWDAMYAASPLEALPWFCDAFEPDLLAFLEAHGPRGGRFLDLGAGPGTASIEAARRGFSVVATDISPRALDAASARASSLPIAFVADDITRTNLRGTFDVIHDRGCLHTLDPAEHRAVARTIARLAAPGALFLLKVMSDAEPMAGGPHRFRRQEAIDLFASDFDLLAESDDAFIGTVRRQARAFAFRKRR